jgi:hypothetical protein
VGRDDSGAVIKLKTTNGSLSTFRTNISGGHAWDLVSEERTLNADVTKQGVGIRTSLQKVSSEKAKPAIIKTSCTLEVDEPLCTYDTVQNVYICTPYPVRHTVDGTQDFELGTEFYTFDHSVEILSPDLQTVLATINLHSRNGKFYGRGAIGSCVRNRRQW